MIFSREQTQKTGILWFLNVILIPLFFAHITLAAPSIPDVVKDNGLVYCTNANGFSFNPQTSDAGTSMNVVTEQIYNKLFELKDNTDKVKPMLAKSYRISKDGKEIIIYLRHGVKFHQTPWFTPTRNLNAEDVVFSLNRMLDKNIALPTLDNPQKNNGQLQYKIFHDHAKNVTHPYFDSIKLTQKIKKVEALSPYVVKISLFKPDASILSHLASQYAIIFSQEYALQLNADDNLAQLDLLPVGTGPYQLKNYFRNQYVRLVRNDNYWGRKAKIKNIVIDLSTDRAGRLIKFLNNECQIAASPEVSQLGLLNKNNERYYVKSTEGMNLAYLAFNFNQPMMQRNDIRRAISQAINRERIVSRIYHHTATVANNIIPSVSWASVVNTPDYAYGYQPKKAKEILAPLKLTLNLWVLNEERVYNPSPIKMAELIETDLESVGVKVNVRYITRTYLSQSLSQGTANYDLILTGWIAGNLDPDSFMRPILGCGTQSEMSNLSHWCYEPFENAMDQAINSEHLRTRIRDYNIAQEIALVELPILPIANVKRILLTNSRVKGLKLTPFGNLHFSELSLKKGFR